MSNLAEIYYTKLEPSTIEEIKIGDWLIKIKDTNPDAIFGSLIDGELYQVIDIEKCSSGAEQRCSEGWRYSCQSKGKNIKVKNNYGDHVPTCFVAFANRNGKELK